MKRQWAVRACGATVIAFLISACGGAASDEGTADSEEAPARIDACELVPESEMESLVGTPVARTNGNFSEHTYVEPVTYTASCMYMGERTVMLAVNYPASSGYETSERLAQRVTEILRSQVGSDPTTDAVFESTQVRPVHGLAGPAAEYEMMGQTTLEVHTDGVTVKIMAASLDDARRVAEKAIERLE